MTNTRFKNNNWRLYKNEMGVVPAAHAQVATLMDIRDLLEDLNHQARLTNHHLSEIRRNKKKVAK